MMVSIWHVLCAWYLGIGGPYGIYGFINFSLLFFLLSVFGGTKRKQEKNSLECFILESRLGKARQGKPVVRWQS